MSSFLLIGFSGQAQEDSAHTLSAVTVVAIRDQNDQTGKKLQRFDSLSLLQYKASSLSDLLSDNNSIHIKSYGPANLSTTSFRGGSASQTALLWNGFNIQNPMLGQSDLSILPVGLFDNISLQYGGATALWGSGAVGGSILLNNNPDYHKGLEARAGMSAGSFGTQKYHAGVLWSGSNFISNTKAYYVHSDNNYSYRDTNDTRDPLKRQQHADYTMKGILQELYYRHHYRQRFNLRLWYNHTDRNLPPTLSAPSNAFQEDESLKLSGEWQYDLAPRWTARVRAAWFNDQLNYTDSISQTFSNSRMHSLIGEADLKYTLNAYQRFFLGLNSSNYTAITANYDGQPYQYRQALVLGYSGEFLNRRQLSMNISLRQELANSVTLPLTGNLGISYALFSWLNLKASGSRVYRLPTLNDLYWNPGGNPDLKPEEGWAFDATVELKKTYKAWKLLVSGSYFNRRMDNWIIWLPGTGGVWSPRNLRNVYSRGTETSIDLGWTKKAWQVKLQGNSSYVLSTNTTAASESDNSVGKQLIYTPRYSFGGKLTLVYQRFFIAYNQTYTGYRFTSTDNLSWLPPYTLASLKTGYSFRVGKLDLSVNASINNLFNENYQVVADRPMPLRYYEAGLSIKYNYKKQEINQQQ